MCIRDSVDALIAHVELHVEDFEEPTRDILVPADDGHGDEHGDEGHDDEGHGDEEDDH